MHTDTPGCEPTPVGTHTQNQTGTQVDDVLASTIPGSGREQKEGLGA